MTRDQLKGSRFSRVYPEIYAEAGLGLYGVGAFDEAVVHLSTRSRNPRRVQGIVVHRHNYLGQVQVVNQCRVLSPERCLVDAGNHFTLAELIATGDGLIAQGHTTRADLEIFVTESHFDGVLKSRRAVELINPRSESFRESLVRVMLQLAGLPVPECNVSFGDSEFIARMDLSYRQWLVAIEYDERQHGLSLAQRERDVRRRELMERLGWVFIVITAAQMNRPREIVRRVYETLRSRGYQGPQPEFTTEWHQSFGLKPRFVR